MGPYIDTNAVEAGVSASLDGGAMSFVGFCGVWTTMEGKPVTGVRPVCPSSIESNPRVMTIPLDGVEIGSPRACDKPG